MKDIDFFFIQSSGNGIGATGVDALSKSLKINTSLTELDLSSLTIILVSSEH